MKQLLPRYSIINCQVINFLVFLLVLTVFVGCKKKNSDNNLIAEFSFTYIDDNNVSFENQSSGEYYSLTWDFGNGTIETTTDKKKVYTIYYPTKGDYQVSLKLNGYTGESEITTKTVSIAQTELIVSFTAEIDLANPNYVNLVNTTQGEYDSLKWFYRDLEVDNVNETQAYFPFTGSYNIELYIFKNGSAFSASKTVTIAQDDPNYNGLIWSDEFDYTGLPDPSKWNMEIGGDGWGNNELQYYTDSENNAYVDNGVLTITARKESVGGRDYTSARITTQNKFDFKYGRIEARIKLPYGQGMWPAFWMLGKNFNTVGWPACGEVDIMEMVGGTGQDNTVYATLHWDNNGENASYGESYTLPNGIFADDFHLFSVEWDSQKIVAFMDDTQYYQIDITPEQVSEFHQNFFVILNMAVGGDWPGPPDGTTEFPQTMKVDYVRVYQYD